MSNTNWETYDYFLKRSGKIEKEESIQTALDSFNELIAENPSYQTEATRNGEIQPLLAIRNSTKTCKVYPVPGEDLFIGDLVGCYDEMWLVVEMYTDEYGLSTGTMWLCNWVLNYQNGTPDILSSYCVVDDGSYASLTEKSLTTANAAYSLYIPLNEDTGKMFIDKRLSIGKMYNHRMEEILQVMRIIWIDKVNKSFGSGSHMLKFRLEANVYDAEHDNLENMICDYILPIENPSEPDNEGANDTVNEPGDGTENNEEVGVEQDPSNPKFSYQIQGKDTIRVGTSRTYKALITDENGEEVEGILSWKVDNDSCSLLSNGSSCVVTVKLDGDLVGTEITLSLSDEEKNIVCDKVIEVVTIG